MLLLLDGSVLCQQEGSWSWVRLRPVNGSYERGKWSSVANGPNLPLYYASAVLKDGRVFVAGGEYNGGTTAVNLLAAEIYDPVGNMWTSVDTFPTGWTNIGDAPCCVLPDGRVLLAHLGTNQVAIFDPNTMSWTNAANRPNLPSRLPDSSSEETWTLLPDNTVLTVQCSNPPNAIKYVIASDQWVSAGATPTNLTQPCPPPQGPEIGPAILLPDGRVFAIGASGNTALYTMPTDPLKPGTWAPGPTLNDTRVFPTVPRFYAMDAPACLLPNGKVLCCAGPPPPCPFPPPPTVFLEYDPATNSITALSDWERPSNSSVRCYKGRMLLLPTGQVLFSSGSNIISIYTSDLAFDNSWRPQVRNIWRLSRDIFRLDGLQINGLSQAVSYGDDASMATNYPLIRITDAAGLVYFSRTFNHSTMAVSTGEAVHSTQFTTSVNTERGPSKRVVPAFGVDPPPPPEEITITIPVGRFKLEVIANGIPSEPLPLIMPLLAPPAPNLNDILRANKIYRPVSLRRVAASLGMAPPISVKWLATRLTL